MNKLISFFTGIAHWVRMDSIRLMILLFLLKTFFFYFVLDYFFIAYTGLTIPGGSLNLTFVQNHLDLISLFRQFLLWGASKFLSIIGYSSTYTKYTLDVEGGASVRMVYSCIGFSLISAFASLVLAWPARWSYRVISLIGGITIIVVLNMIRVGGLAVLYTTGNYGFFDYINHHELFNIIVILVTFFMFRMHIKYSVQKNTAA